MCKFDEPGIGDKISVKMPDGSTLSAVQVSGGYAITDTNPDGEVHTAHEKPDESLQRGDGLSHFSPDGYRFYPNYKTTEISADARILNG